MKTLLIFVRHGQRADQLVDGVPREKIEVRCDPHITSDGKAEAFTVGETVIAPYIISKGFGDCPIKYISSPFVRAM
jgi:broad specificity phosphatase PhoE